MSKYANPISYTGKRSTKKRSGQARFASEAEAIAKTKEDVTISPSTLSASVTDLLPAVLTAKMASPGEIGGTVASVATFTTVAATTGLEVKGGAVTNSIGQVTLASGTATVLNTNITTSSRIFLTRRGVNSSTALGELNVSAITASTSFVITSQDLVTPANTATGDLSTVDYLIVEQI